MVPFSPPSGERLSIWTDLSSSTTRRLLSSASAARTARAAKGTAGTAREGPVRSCSHRKRRTVSSLYACSALRRWPPRGVVAVRAPPPDPCDPTTHDDPRHRQGVWHSPLNQQQPRRRSGAGRISPPRGGAAASSSPRDAPTRSGSGGHTYSPRTRFEGLPRVYTAAATVRHLTRSQPDLPRARLAPILMNGWAPHHHRPRQRSPRRARCLRSARAAGAQRGRGSAVLAVKAGGGRRERFDHRWGARSHFRGWWRADMRRVPE